MRLNERGVSTHSRLWFWVKASLTVALMIFTVVMMPWRSERARPRAIKRKERSSVSWRSCQGQTPERKKKVQRRPPLNFLTSSLSDLDISQHFTTFDNSISDIIRPIP